MLRSFSFAIDDTAMLGRRALIIIGMAIPHPTTLVNVMPRAAKNALPLPTQLFL
jgi:hypothetical protein